MELVGIEVAGFQFTAVFSTRAKRGRGVHRCQIARRGTGGRRFGDVVDGAASFGISLVVRRDDKEIEQFLNGCLDRPPLGQVLPAVS